MKKYQFKTTMKCDHCVAKVREKLDAVAEIAHWEVDLKSPNRILIVESEQEGVVAQVSEILKKNGFRIEQIFWNGLVIHKIMLNLEIKSVIQFFFINVAIESNYLINL